MKNEHLSREDYEAIVFSDTPADMAETGIRDGESSGPETISFTTEDGRTYIFIPLGIFSIDDRQYMLVRDSAQTDDSIHLLLCSQDKDGSDIFQTVSGEEFQQVMQAFEHFLKHTSQEE